MNNWNVAKRVIFTSVALLGLIAGSYLWLQLRAVVSQAKNIAELHLPAVHASAQFEAQALRVALLQSQMNELAAPQRDTLSNEWALATAQLSVLSNKLARLNLPHAPSTSAPVAPGIFADLHQAAHSAVAAHDRFAQSAFFRIFALLAASALAGATLAFIILRNASTVIGRITDALSSGARALTEATQQVSSGSHSIAENASEQAASLEQTSASLEEMSSMTKQNAGNAKKAEDLASQTRTAAETGAVEMKQMLAAMDAIKSASGNIAKIIKTIDEIAFQTNILALNAAVEAARAGEAGMGFAVVADEVRNLAQRSAQAAQETASKIEDSIQKSEHGVDISARVQQHFEDIVTKAREVYGLVAEIATASQEQSQGISQINQAVTQMDQVTQSNAAASEQTAGAAEELTANAAQIAVAVTDLLEIVGTKPSAPTPAASPATDPHSDHDAPKKNGAPHSPSHTSVRRNGRAASPRVLTPAHSRPEDAIPMDGDFKDF